MNTEQRIVDLKERIIRAFADVPHPGSPGKILAIPCCPEHDAVAEWFSLHTWRDFEEALEKEDLDLTSYGSLFPAAYHYFLQAVLIYIVQNADRDPGAGNWGTKVWRPMDRVYHTVAPWPRSKEKWSRELKSDYVPLFSAEQRNVVVRVLEFVCAFGIFPEEEIDETLLDIKTAKKEIWEIGS
jgi:hypothetical protein